MKKRVIVSASNDLATDQRVRKQCQSLAIAGYSVFLVGRLLPDSLPLERPYPVRRMKLFFRRGALFYAELNIRLFFLLLFKKADIFYANDLDTLPANFLVSALRRKPLIYDSHEYFTEVPEIQNRPLVKATWKFFEKSLISHCDVVVTVNSSLAKLLQRTYKISDVVVVRNVPDKIETPTPVSREEIGVSEEDFLVILQGSGINVDRGAEEVVEALDFVENVVLLIVGGGDAVMLLKRMVAVRDAEKKVIFKPKMPYTEMMEYTAAADLGVSVDKDTNVNYRYSLPNKLFDYILAGTPVLVSDLVEVRKTVEELGVGYILPSHDREEIARTIDNIRNDPEKLREKAGRCKEAAKTISWEMEFASVIGEMEKLHK